MRELTPEELGMVGGGTPNSSFFAYANLPAHPSQIHGPALDAIATNGLFGTPIGPTAPGRYTGSPTGTFMTPIPPRQPTPFEFFQIINGAPRNP